MKSKLLSFLAILGIFSGLQAMELSQMETKRKRDAEFHWPQGLEEIDESTQSALAGSAKQCAKSSDLEFCDDCLTRKKTVLDTLVALNMPTVQADLCASYADIGVHEDLRPLLPLFLDSIRKLEYPMEFGPYEFSRYATYNGRLYRMPCLLKFEGFKIWDMTDQPNKLIYINNQNNLAIKYRVVNSFEISQNYILVNTYGRCIVIDRNTSKFVYDAEINSSNLRTCHLHEDYLITSNEQPYPTVEIISLKNGALVNIWEHHRLIGYQNGLFVILDTNFLAHNLRRKYKVYKTSAPETMLDEFQTEIFQWPQLCPMFVADCIRSPLYYLVQTYEKDPSFFRRIVEGENRAVTDYKVAGNILYIIYRYGDQNGNGYDHIYVINLKLAYLLKQLDESLLTQLKEFFKGLHNAKNLEAFEYTEAECKMRAALKAQCPQLSANLERYLNLVLAKEPEKVVDAYATVETLAQPPVAQRLAYAYEDARNWAHNNRFALGAAAVGSAALVAWRYKDQIIKFLGR